MFWNRLASFLLGGSVFATQPIAPAVTETVGLSELTSYECARDVASLDDVDKPQGPLFRVANLIVTSVEDAAFKPRLVVSAGGGLYTLGLEGAGLNRLRFDLRDGASSGVSTFYLGYLHDARLGSRLLEFGVGEPPLGHFEFDYSTRVPTRAPGLVPHVEYAAFLTSAKLRQAVREGRIARGRAPRRPSSSCDYLARENPALALGLQTNMDAMDGITENFLRRPASLR